MFLDFQEYHPLFFARSISRNVGILGKLSKGDYEMIGKIDLLSSFLCDCELFLGCLPFPPC